MKDDLSKKIKELRKTLGLKQTEFAKRLGINDNSAVSKWERGIQNPSAEYTPKIADMAGVTVGAFLGLQPMDNDSVVGRQVVVAGDVVAGEWREAIEWPPEDWKHISIPSPPGWDGIPLRGYVVRGTSMNRYYHDGTYVFVASTIANGIRPRSGNKVLVTRRDRNGLYEATLKEFVVDETGRKWLWPRSYDPEHQTPIAYQGDSEEVTITGIVAASFMAESMR